MNKFDASNSLKFLRNPACIYMALNFEKHFFAGFWVHER